MAAMLSVVAAGTARAQLLPFQRPTTAIEHARVVRPDGTVIENATIVIRGGEIARIGAGLPAPENAQTIDAKGFTVTPGLIDVSSTLGATGGGAGGDPTLRAFDAFNRYADEEITGAYRNGITTVYLPARGGAGINGTGAVVRLVPDLSGEFIGEAIREEADLWIDLGSDASPLNRLIVFDDVRGRFRAAKEYREARDAYFEEDLPEYEEKLAERAKKRADAEGKNGEKKESGESKNGGSGGGQNGQNGKDKKEDDKIEKPAEPAVDRQKEVLLRALDGDLPVRIVAHRAEDILNALELIEEFNLVATIEGATEAHLVAEPIAAAEVPVVLSATIERTGAERSMRDGARRSARALEAAGATWVVGTSDGGDEDGRFLLVEAMMLTPHDADRDAIGLVTKDAASFLNLPLHGEVAPGKVADLVFWSGDPLAPGTRVERVLVNGRVVYDAARDEAVAALDAFDAEGEDS